jgi:LDH2 family malate/lactate/ureidoglycolate dehydrogenase
MDHYRFNRTIRIQPEILKGWSSRVFQAAGMNGKDADLTADTLVMADARGVYSHGCLRVPLYVKRIETGCVSPTARPEVLRSRGATALIDGHNAMGQVVSCCAMNLAIEKAAEHGVSFVSVRGSNHYGACAYYAMMALPKNMIGYTSTIGGGNLMAPWGGCENRVGNNPFGVAIPALERDPVVLDMAMSVVAKGKIVMATKTKSQIPEEWAVDSRGLPTTDPHAAIEGSIRPIADYKGYGLSVIISMISSVISNAAIGSTLKDIYGNFTEPLAIGHSFAAIDLDYLTDIDEFKRNMDREIGFIKNSRKAAGSDEIFLPGEREARNYQRQMQNGIDMPAEVIDEIRGISTRLGAAVPELE